MSLKLFTGNCAGNIGKDKKYTIRTDGPGKFKIGLLFRAGNGETWHMSSVEHLELVRMVNKIKEEVSGVPGGSFYINEYRQVVVPATDGVNERKMYLAGEYDTPLFFNFDGKSISTRPELSNGTLLQPGDSWHGPRIGIRYTLAVGGTDIRYESTPRPNVTKTISLINSIGIARANLTLYMIKPFKREGGAIYINDSLSVIAPITSDPTEFIYCGQINLDAWFPKP